METKTQKKKNAVHTSIRLPKYMADFLTKKKNVNFSQLVRLSLESELTRIYGSDFLDFKEQAEEEIKRNKLFKR